jgi:hypothetical protein
MNISKIEIDKLIILFRSIIEIKDIYYKLKKYKNCFVGKEAVNKMMEFWDIKDRNEAILIGRRLEDLGLFSHILNHFDFQDENHYYKINENFDKKEEKKEDERKNKSSSLIRLKSLGKSDSFNKLFKFRSSSTNSDEENRATKYLENNEKEKEKEVVEEEVFEYVEKINENKVEDETIKIKKFTNETQEIIKNQFYKKLKEIKNDSISKTNGELELKVSMNWDSLYKEDEYENLFLNFFEYYTKERYLKHNIDIGH